MKPDLTLPALSIRQPWAWLILHAGKDIENRNWKTDFRGRFLIHAAKGMTQEEYHCAFDFAWNRAEFKSIPFELKLGGIIGEAEIIGCVTKSDSCWFEGKYGFVIRNPKPVEFLPCRGALGFFKVKDFAPRLSDSVANPTLNL